MKRTLIIFIAILITLFAGITLLKNCSSHLSPKISISEKTTDEKEKIQQFWQFYRQATQYRLSGKMADAAKAYGKALKFNEMHEDALYYLGNVYLELGEVENAEKIWKRLIEINPNSARAHFQLGDLYISLEDEKVFNIDAAKTEYLRAHEINKEETGSTLRLGYVALLRGDLLEAKRYFNAVIGSNYKSVEAYFLNGYVAWKRGNPKSALTLFKTAGKYLHPELPVQGVLGEGDTKKGLSFSLSDSSKHQNLFDNFIRDLSKLDKISISQQMDNLYEKLDVFLKEIREKI
jgi:tetratricopeptide (TPR) repeat protein